MMTDAQIAREIRTAAKLLSVSPAQAKAAQRDMQKASQAFVKLAKKHWDVLAFMVPDWGEVYDVILDTFIIIDEDVS